MGSDEWFEKNGELYREPMIDERYLFEAGAASRQAEVDELQKRINDLTNISESLVSYKNQLLDELKGESNE